MEEKDVHNQGRREERNLREFISKGNISFLLVWSNFFRYIWVKISWKDKLVIFQSSAINDFFAL